MRFYILSALVIIINSCSNKTMIPKAKKIPHKMDIHNSSRIDNYYWMRLTDNQKIEKDKDEQTKNVLQYINEENDYLESEFSKLKPFQKDLYNEMIGRIKKDDSSVPYLNNGYFYYRRFEDKKEYPIYCRKKNSLDAQEEIFLDINILAIGHDYISVPSYYISPDNNYAAYAVDTLSRRVYSMYIKNLKTGEVLDSYIPNTDGDFAWANDNQTVFYTSKNEVTLLSNKVYKHNINTNYQKDKLVYEEKDEAYYNGVYRSKSGEYIIIYNSSTLVSDYHIIDANKPDSDFKNFTPRLENHEYSIEHFDDSFYIITNKDALNNKLMIVSEKNTNIMNWDEVIAHQEEVHILDMEIFKKHLVLSERREGLLNLKIVNLDTKSDFYIDFGESVYSSYLSTNEEFDTNILRYYYTSLLTPGMTVDYDMDTGVKKILKQQEVVGGYNHNEYISDILYPLSEDGQKIPTYIVYKKDLKKDKPQPLLLYGYGSYGSTENPYFSSTRLSLLDRGFIYAVTNVRGTEIYGKQSYNDGKMLKKINSFTDFINVGESLIEKGFTNSQNLFCMGGSAGGLLIGAVLNMAPDLWKGAISSVPFVDVVTTMLDPTIPLTSNEWDEWGNPLDEEYYNYMLSYSPYDQIKKIEYPNLLVTSGFFDSQVQYWEPLKYVAKLREHWKGDNKLYLLMNMDAGHGGKSGRFRKYNEVALEYVFLLNLAGITK